ncbi:hypothetical protein TPHA_0A00700 [Tetrapisispora phaffii CBS 4417]|uniref:Vacuolar protein sorting-associated protein 52 n=1 Tax=Tetrapisispora phaffii (strain ATCC 24235 / CBS 4417 / NBRC 1672 / NRRL Y-8282 / UCD 70-5) TaxID=1071381 RepID=G8BMM7_TETPH|nr:hypothetical protein TPHA_0A00700 [Tetrapisispora phaffii CBS 4417]CCE61155.1 hypothetical protein TPHA_0A00700 [Tetrapisispora phaffii CBS 4417]
MDELCAVLNISKSQLDTIKKTNLKEDQKNSDIFQSYIDSCNKNSNNESTDDVLQKLNELQTKHEKVMETLSKTIPPLREYMEQFNSKLVEYTGDLGMIRNKSSELKVLLENNSTKLSKVSPIVNDLIISPEVVNGIISGEIDPVWVEHIGFIRDKKEIYQKYKRLEDSEKPKDFEQMLKILENLEIVILERSKKYIVHKIKNLRSFNTAPSQKIQYELIQVKEIFSFILENNYSLALELRQAYAYTMKWYYKSYFGRYIRSLTILPFRHIDAQYALGSGLTDTSVSYLNGYGIANYLSTSYTKGTSFTTDEAIQSYFQIEKRLTLLTQEDNTVMVSQIAENNSRENFIEIGFKNLNLAVLDNCTVEFKFLTNFLKIGENLDELRALCEQIFQPTLDEIIQYTKDLVLYSYDIFGVLISIRIAQQLQFEAKRRDTPVISDFMDVQLITLWPKLQQLIDFQCESLRNVSSNVNVAKISSNNSNMNLSRTDDPLTTPHELTVQFSKFLTSLLKLTITHINDIDERSEPIYNSIIRIRNDFETVMTKCSKKVKSSERFLATNYMYLYNVLQKQHLQEDDSVESIPLIIEETENHYYTLVQAYSRS